MTCSSLNSKVLMFAIISSAASSGSDLCSESAPGARRMDPVWVTEVRDQCLDARVLLQAIGKIRTCLPVPLGRQIEAVQSAGSVEGAGQQPEARLINFVRRGSRRTVMKKYRGKGRRN